MSLREAAFQWHADGELDAEHAQFEQLLGQRNFTKEQIAFCFTTMLPGLALLAADRETNVLTLEALQTALRKTVANEAHVIEVCIVLADAQLKPEHEVLDDLIRVTANKIWQRQPTERDAD